MGANAATKLVRIADNTETVLAIELMNAAQALDFRRPQKSSPKLEQVMEDYRKVVPFINEDTYMRPHIIASVDFLREKTYL